MNTKPKTIYTPTVDMDLILYGEAFVRLRPDGSQERIDPSVVSYFVGKNKPLGKLPRQGIPESVD